MDNLSESNIAKLVGVTIDKKCHSIIVDDEEFFVINAPKRGPPSALHYVKWLCAELSKRGLLQFLINTGVVSNQFCIGWPVVGSYVIRASLQHIPCRIIEREIKYLWNKPRDDFNVAEEFIICNSSPVVVNGDTCRRHLYFSSVELPYCRDVDGYLYRLVRESELSEIEDDARVMHYLYLSDADNSMTIEEAVVDLYCQIVTYTTIVKDLGEENVTFGQCGLPAAMVSKKCGKDIQCYDDCQVGDQANLYSEFYPLNPEPTYDNPDRIYIRDGWSGFINYDNEIFIQGSPSKFPKYTSRDYECKPRVCLLCVHGL